MSMRTHCGSPPVTYSFTMQRGERRTRADRALAGYPSGPEATRRARDLALGRAQEARLVVLVEGVSDLMALEAVAERQGRDLSAERIVVVPVGGAHAFELHLEPLRQRAIEVRALVDRAEELIVRDTPGSLGVYMCVEDLEDELIRAVGPVRVEAILEREGDLGSFRTLQNQPAWREGDVTSQLRRFMGAGARRKLRYARLLAQELDPDRIPLPLVRVLEV